MKNETWINTEEKISEQDDGKSKLLHSFNLYFPHLRPPEIIVERMKEGYTARLLLFGGIIENSNCYPNSSDATNHICGIGYRTILTMVDAIKSMKVSKEVGNNVNGESILECDRSGVNVEIMRDNEYDQVNLESGILSEKWSNFGEIVSNGKE